MPTAKTKTTKLSAEVTAHERSRGSSFRRLGCRLTFQSLASTVRAYHLVAVVASVAACGEEAPLREPPVAPDDPAPPPILVSISLPAPAPAVRWHEELGGTLVAHLEIGLADLPGVIAEVSGTPRAPGFDGPIWPDASLVTVRPSIAPAGDEVRFEVEVCHFSAPCSNHSATSTREAPAAAIAELLGALAEDLGRAPAPGAARAWARPPSRDSYAVLLEGRAAGVFYGIMPTADAPEGDPRRDPIRRAVLVDPKMPVAGWILGRRELERGRLGVARSVLDRGLLARPTSVALIVASARAEERYGSSRGAQERWVELVERAPDDLRFVLPRFDAALSWSDFDSAQAILEQVPPRYAGVALVLAARVALLEARGEVADDALLARWQAASPADTDPVRRRIAARVRAGRYAEALELVPELERRGLVDEVLDLQIALRVAVGDREGAAEVAASGGRPEVGRALRAALAATPAERVTALADVGSPVLLAEALLASGDPTGALQSVDQALSLRPHDPRALHVRGTALVALGRSNEASRAFEAAESADPLGVVRGLSEAQ